MKKAILIILILLSFIGSVCAQTELQQFYGTHVFFEKPVDYFFSSMLQFSYIKSDYSIILSSIRTFTGIQEILKILDTPQVKKLYLEDTNKVVFLVEINNTGRGKTLFTFPVGDDTESTLIIATIPQNQNVINSEQEIFQIFKTIWWEPESDLHFEDAYFFENIELGQFKPAAILGNRICFTTDGEDYINNPLILYIGQNIAVSNYKGKEDEIFDMLFAMGFKDNEYTMFDKNKRTINGLLCITAKGKSKEKNLYYSVFFDGTMIYFVGEESKSEENDIALMNYQDIVSSFKVKR